MTVKASRSAAMTVPPFNTPRRPSMWAVGQSERLHSVRLRTLPPSRVALAQQDRGRRVPIPNSFDVHAAPCAHPAKAYKSQIWNYMATTCTHEAMADLDDTTS